MKKIILDLAVSLDGFIEGANGETDWCIMDDDMDFEGFLEGIDTIFYGSVSYETWGSYQPGADAGKAEQDLWKAVHAKKKIVFSSQQRQYNTATFISGEISEKVAEIKNEKGKDIWLYGGSGLIKTFIDLDLVDVYRISVHPVVLGAGKPLFAHQDKRIELKLIKTNAFRSGVVQLIYEPVR